MPLASERRVVTVLFSDLSGFTGLSEGMDPEDIRDVVDALFSRFRAVIESHGGTVDKYIGDAVMAVFGAPVARGDDPLRAVRAGLAMQRELAAFNAERGISLAMRLGVNSGEVLWGGVGGDARPTAMGDAVNVAQRLESSARPGTVLVSRTTEHATRRSQRYIARGEVALRGRAEPVEVFEAMPLEDGGTEAREAPVPLVGRETELAGLWTRLRAGRASGVVVEGDAGRGKSRLAAEFRRQVREARFAEVLVGRCLESARLPLAPFGEMVRGDAGSGADPERLVASLTAMLRPTAASDADAGKSALLMAISTGVAVPGSGAGIDQARIVPETRLAWASWLRARAAGRPLLVVIEDLHWADEATRSLLGELPLLLEGTPAMLLATSRPVGSPPSSWDVEVLREFPEDATAVLAAAHLGAAPDAPLVQYLFEQTGGNPLAVEELSRFLREEGLVGGSPARLLRAPDRVPSGLQSLLVARIDALAGPVRETLKAASVLGREFWPALVAVLLGRDVTADLEEARRQELVLARSDSLLSGEPQKAFRHALIREAAYSLLPKKDRVRLHVVAAEAFESRAGTMGRRMRQLAAPHREAAGDLAQAAALWRQAYREADTEHAYEESLACAREFRRIADSAESLRAEGLALLNLGRTAEAVECATQYIARPGLTPAEVGSARGILAIGSLRTGNFAACERHAAATLEAVADPPTRFSAFRTRAVALIRLNRFDEAAPMVEGAAEAAKDWAATGTDARPAFADAVWLRAIHLRESGFERLALPHFAHSVELRRALHDPSALSYALNGLAGSYSDAGRMAEARSTFVEALNLARAGRNAASVAQILNNLALLSTHPSEEAEAVRLFEESIALKRKSGDRWGAGLTYMNLGALLITSGRFERAEECLLISEEMLGETGDRINGAVSSSLRALGKALSGRSDEAAICARESLQRAHSPMARLQASLNASAALSIGGFLAESVATADSAIAIARSLEATRYLRIGLELRARILAQTAPTEALASLDAATSLSGAVSVPANKSALDRSLRTRLLVVLGDLSAAAGLPAPPEGVLDRVHFEEDRAVILAAMGRKDEARAAARESVKLALGHGAPGAARPASELLKSLGD